MRKLQDETEGIQSKGQPMRSMRDAIEPSVFVQEKEWRSGWKNLQALEQLHKSKRSDRVDELSLRSEGEAARRSTEGSNTELKSQPRRMGQVGSRLAKMSSKKHTHWGIQIGKLEELASRIKVAKEKATRVIFNGADHFKRRLKKSTDTRRFVRPMRKNRQISRRRKPGGNFSVQGWVSFLDTNKIRTDRMYSANKGSPFGRIP